ncbi:MAG: ExbD/TolR family protein [Sandaracinaceae bacterium]
MRFRSEDGEREPRIEITPLIDVVFQLLIFFLLTTSFITQRTLEVELPRADAAATRTEALDVLVLTVTSEGQVAEGERLLSEEELIELLRDVASGADAAIGRPTLLLRADGRASHEMVVRVMDLALQQRLTRIALATKSVERAL